MAIRKYKPTTPGRRGSSVSDFAEITRSTPEKSLIRPLHGTGGRNAHGRITTRHKGGGHKRAYRVIDFRRYDKDGVPAKVAHIEYDPNRTANIALLHYYDKKTGRKSRRGPQFAKKGMKIIALIETTAPVCLERFRDYAQLGRFTLRDEGKTVAIGKVTKLLSDDDVPNVGKLSIN